MHVAALESPAAVGQRYIANGERFSVRDLAQMLRDDFGTRAELVSTKEMPAWLLRFAALFNAEAKSAVPLLGDRATLKADKALRDLGWRTRSMGDTLRDMVNSRGN